MSAAEIETDMTPSIGALVAALAKAQGAMTGAKKDAVNPHLKSKYADLASVWDAVRGPLSANGLAVIQTTEPAQAGVCVVTLLAHSSGEWIRSRLFMPTQKNDAQGVGSALTYARRYALAAITGIAPDDDDGEEAAKPGPFRSQQWPRTQAVEIAAPEPGISLADRATFDAFADKFSRISKEGDRKAFQSLMGSVKQAHLPKQLVDELRTRAEATNAVLKAREGIAADRAKATQYKSDADEGPSDREVA